MDSKQMGDKYDDMAEEILRVKSYAGTDEAVRELAAALRQARAEAIEECAKVADIREDVAANMSFDAKFLEVGLRYAAAADEANAIAADIRALAQKEG